MPNVPKLSEGVRKIPWQFEHIVSHVNAEKESFPLLEMTLLAMTNEDYVTQGISTIPCSIF